MTPAERFEELLRPFYLLLMTVGYMQFFLWMLPAVVPAVLLGLFPGAVILLQWPAVRGLRAFGRAYGGLPLLAAALWDLLALALSVWFGGIWGYGVLCAAKGRSMGRGVTAAGYFLGRILSAMRKRDKEE